MGLSVRELCWCVRNPSCCRAANSCGQDARKEEQSRYGTTKDNTVNNAIKHCAWLCCMASHPDCTTEQARGFGDAHEYGASGDDTHARPRGMDLHNNEIGLDLATPGATLSDCIAKCEKAAKDGDLCWYEEQSKNATGDLPKKPVSMPSDCAKRIRDLLTRGWFPFLNK